MPHDRSALIAFAALSIGGCTLLRIQERPVQTGTADLFVDGATFEGEDLSARVLIRARGGDLTVQQNLAALSGLMVEDVRDCETGAVMPYPQFVIVELEPPPLIRLQDAHWFGVDTEFIVYAKEFADGKPPPECIDVKIVWWMPHGEDEPSRPVSTSVRVHTRRQDTGTPDAGASLPGDAGA